MMVTCSNHKKNNLTRFIFLLVLVISEAFFSVSSASFPDSSSQESRNKKLRSSCPPKHPAKKMKRQSVLLPRPPLIPKPSPILVPLIPAQYQEPSLHQYLTEFFPVNGPSSTLAPEFFVKPEIVDPSEILKDIQVLRPSPCPMTLQFQYLSLMAMAMLQQQSAARNDEESPKFALDLGQELSSPDDDLLDAGYVTGHYSLVNCDGEGEEEEDVDDFVSELIKRHDQDDHEPQQDNDYGLVYVDFIVD